MNDFDRFKLYGARRKRNCIRSAHYRRIVNKNIKAGCFNKRGKAALQKWKDASRAANKAHLAGKKVEKK